MSKSDPTVTALAVFIEPAPYMTRLSDELRTAWKHPFSAVYLTRQATQPWHDEKSGPCSEVLPQQISKTILRIWQILWSQRPGIVHVAGWSQPKIIAVLVMAKLLGAKTFCSSDTWTSKPSAMREAAKKAIFTLVDHFTPGGRRQAAYLVLLGVSPDRITPAKMTVDVESISQFRDGFSQAEREGVRIVMGVPLEAVVLLVVGRLVPEKGVDVAIAAFRRLRPGHPTYLLIVGEGPDRRRLERLAENHPNIIFTGRLSGRNLWSQYCSADVFVGASDFEPWGLVVNEAMAAGLPVIVTAAFGCVDDLVTDNGTGLVVPVSDVAALAAAMERLVEDSAGRRRMGQQAVERIAPWTTKAQADRIVAAWIRVLKNAPAPRSSQCLTK